MPRRRPASEAALERALDEVRAARAAPAAPGAEAALLRALGHASSLVVGAAGRALAEHEGLAFAQALREAFLRFAGGAPDPGCQAKLATALALASQGIDADEVYLRAVRTVQLEPAYGGPVDSAVPVRIAGALGLARTLHHAAAAHAAELLADPEWDARAGAARALGMCAREAAEPVLRHKLRVGDPEPAVLGDCFRALLGLAPDTLPLVAERLRDADAAVAEQAALALGDSRLDAALDALTAFVEAEPARERRRVALVAIALLRRDAALDWLFARVASADPPTALAILEALAIYRHDERLVARIRAAAGGREELREALRKGFGG